MKSTTLTRLWFASNFILLVIVMGISWSLVYYLSIVPFQEGGGFARLAELLSSPQLGKTLWWRDFLALAFDVLIIAVAIIGTTWVAGHFAVEARDFRKWKKYYKEQGQFDIWVERIGLWERVQHIWMMITFIICAYTGFVMHFANNPYWRFLYISRESYVTIHVVSGLAMGVLVILHATYYGVKVIADKLRGESLLSKYELFQFYTLTFIKTLLRTLAWSITERVQPPKTGKYDEEQTFEYWGVYWGIAVLGVPGLVMLLYGPSAFDGVMWVMHVKEAVLAFVFILLVHIGYTHLRPTVFPYDPTFIHGKMPLKRIKEEHPLWYEKLVREGVIREVVEEGGTPSPTPISSQSSRESGGGVSG